MQTLDILLESLRYAAYYPEWNLVTWHPRGVLDDEMADKVVTLLEWEEGAEEMPFDRFTDFSGLERIQLKIGHMFQIAAHRSLAFESVKSSFYATTVVGLGIARMYEALMKEAYIEVRAFGDRAMAADWLGVPEEILKCCGRNQ